MANVMDRHSRKTRAVGRREVLTMTPASIYRIRRAPPYTVSAAQVVACVAVLALAWSSMVLGAVLVARHAFDAARTRACVDYGPRVTHGPAQVYYYGPTSWQAP